MNTVPAITKAQNVLAALPYQERERRLRALGEQMPLAQPSERVLMQQLYATLLPLHNQITLQEQCVMQQEAHRALLASQRASMTETPAEAQFRREQLRGKSAFGMIIVGVSAVIALCSFFGVVAVLAVVAALVVLRYVTLPSEGGQKHQPPRSNSTGANYTVNHYHNTIINGNQNR